MNVRNVTNFKNVRSEQSKCVKKRIRQKNAAFRILAFPCNQILLVIVHPIVLLISLGCVLSISTQNDNVHTMICHLLLMVLGTQGGPSHASPSVSEQLREKSVWRS